MKVIPETPHAHLILISTIYVTVKRLSRGSNKMKSKFDMPSNLVNGFKFPKKVIINIFCFYQRDTESCAVYYFSAWFVT